MAFLTFDTVTLKDLLQKASTVSTTRSTIDFHTYSKMELLPDGHVIITALNDVVRLTQTAKSNNIEGVSEPLSFAIKTDLITNAILLTVDTLVGMNVDMGTKTLTIQGSKSKHTLRINPELSDSFTSPAIQGDSSAKITVKTSDWQVLTKRCSISLGNPRTVYQPEFLNYCITVSKSDTAIIATTDRYRVTKMNVPVSQVSHTFAEDSKNFLLPPKYISVLDKLDPSKELVIELYPDRIVTTSGNTVIHSAYGEGNFPDYNKIIPASFVCSFAVASSELIEGLKQVNYFARLNPESKSVKLVIKPTESKMIISSKTTDGYASEATVDLIDYQGPTDEWEQSFNVEYLWSFISTIKESHLIWEANPGKPSVLSPKNKKEELLYLVSGLK